MLYQLQLQNEIIPALANFQENRLAVQEVHSHDEKYTGSQLLSFRHLLRGLGGEQRMVKSRLSGKIAPPQIRLKPEDAAHV